MRRCLSLAVLSVLSLALPATRSDDKRPAKDAVDLATFDAKIKPADRQHWAYQPVKPQTVPKVRDRAWVRNPIDAFILAGLEEKGWRPAAPVEPRGLLRRVYLDLTGLPPTLAEQDAFVNDSSGAAFERVVEDLLARPSYGERWGRHWLDLVRYAETNGYERDSQRPFVWRYRDYVIKAFNDDKPFDRFIIEQLAGDELPDANADTLIATGYYRLGPWDDEPADPQEDRFDQLDDIVGTTSLAFLGLTLSCARCHDHKFEALTMHDYYRMVATFNGLTRPTRGRTELVLPAGSRREIATERQRDRQLGALTRTALTTRALLPLMPLSGSFDAGASAFRAATPDLPRGYFMQESSKTPDTHLLLRGKATNPGPNVQPGLPAVLVRQQPGPNAGGSRLALARWIARPDNPLTARVIVNRVWQYHFGEGIVRTPSDFGVMGQQPTHPELLDWLASWFVEHDWSIKSLHRLILSSNTYRMSKRWHKEYAAVDPTNERLWRFPYRRLEVEAIRDSMLSVSGSLNPRMYGPWMYPEMPKEVLAAHADLDKIWKPFEEREASRRTIYAHIKRSMVVPMLEVLDLCDTARSTERRAVTTVAPQALTLFNGDFVNRQARHLAERLVREVGEDIDKQIDRAYLLALCRRPTEKERQVLVRYLQDETLALLQTGAVTTARRRALEQMCRVVLNLNEFVYAD